jgi:phage recombination protein Bet
MTEKSKEQLPAIMAARLPYHPAIQERFGIDKSGWRALTDAIFPSARSTDAVILALSYCRARGLDPFKRTVHIVPIWDKERQCEVETVWPGIAEHRTTAHRTHDYAGHDEVVHGPMKTQTWDDVDRKGNKYGEVTVSFPEWAQLTVYKMVAGQRCSFPGRRVYWLETYASKKNGCPNSMWADRPIGMIDKCAEAEALRSAFPEELGGDYVAEEVGAHMFHGRMGIVAPTKQEQAGSRTDNLADRLTKPAITQEPEPQEFTAFAHAQEAVTVVRGEPAASDLPQVHSDQPPDVSQQVAASEPTNDQVQQESDSIRETSNRLRGEYTDRAMEYRDLAALGKLRIQADADPGLVGRDKVGTLAAIMAREQALKPKRKPRTPGEQQTLV